MQLLLLFLEGIITFISPCLLPMLPLYVSYFAAGEAGEAADGTTGSGRRTLINSLGFVLGFTLVFTLLGAFAGTLGRLLISYATAVNIVTGAIVILFGLVFMGIIKLRLPNRFGGKVGLAKELRFFSSIIFGVVFSVAWTPCVGAFLGSALMMASWHGDTLTGMLMLLVYSLGLGIPFVLSAILIDRLKGAFDFIKRHYKVINIAAGILLICVGALMATGLLGRYLSLLAI
ncbi:MAG: cytochrome c biogenesis protein CcdA [Clostridiales bacterium]|nr:cytochrome c biogenesis protein CcdA [Clostridiales bacterium]